MKVDKNIKVNTLKTKEKDMVYSFGQMVEFIKVVGKKENNMEKVFTKMFKEM